MTDTITITYDRVTITKDEYDALKKDAERYRWLRVRLKVKKLQTVNGKFKNGFDIRIGQSIFKYGGNTRKAYFDKSNFDAECSELDKEIDTAIGEKK